MPHPWNKVQRRLGRRGAILLTMGITYVLIGWKEIVTKEFDGISGAFHLLAPEWIRGALWVASGIVAIVFSLRRGNDKWGWQALYLMPYVRIASYLGAWIIYESHNWFGIPESIHGYELGWYVAALHFPFIIITLVCSGWQEGSPKWGERIQAAKGE